MRGHPQLCVCFSTPPHSPPDLPSSDTLCLPPPSVPHPVLPKFSFKSNLIFPLKIQIEIKNTILCISTGLSYFFAEKFLFKNFCWSLGIQLPDNYRSLCSFLCTFQRNDLYGVCKKKFFLRRLICHHSIEN